MQLADQDYLTVALPKGKLFGLSADLFAKIGYTAEGLSDKSRKLVISNDEKKIRFIVSKTADVPTYVEYGAADIGIIGKDVLVESQKDVYELFLLTMRIRAWPRSSRISRRSSSASTVCRWSISS